MKITTYTKQRSSQPGVRKSGNKHPISEAELLYQLETAIAEVEEQAAAGHHSAAAAFHSIQLTLERFLANYENEL